MKTAIYAICIGDQTLVNLIAKRVYTFVPQQTLFPYIRIGVIVGGDGGTKTSPGQTLTVPFDVFSREKGDLELDKIMRRIINLFHEKEPKIEAGVVSICRFISSTIQQDSDGITRHGVVRFRMNVYEDNP